MYKLRFSLNAEYGLRKYIDSYEDFFVKLFTGTGIFNEGIIISQYILITNNLYSQIREVIMRNLIADTIYGRKYNEDNSTYRVILKASNQKIFIEYREDMHLKIRYIENIKIFKI